MEASLSVIHARGPGFKTPGHTYPYRYSYRWSNQYNERTPCELYQKTFDCVVNSAEIDDVIIYAHDDVTIHDADWYTRVMEQFTNPQVAAVGLGGAIGLGHPDLYKRRYQLNDMARYGYVSNQTDWQTHGELSTGVTRVAVLDAFFMAVRVDFLKAVGGWPVDHLSHHCLDLWLACEAARHGKSIIQVGVSCTHHGGGTSTKPEYANAKWLQGGSLEKDHQYPHKFLYDQYRDVLPFAV